MSTPTLDVTGQSFYNLTALHPTADRQDGSVIWVWQCTCGNQIRVSLRNVKYTASRGRADCGCITIRGRPSSLPLPKPGDRHGMLTVKRVIGRSDPDYVPNRGLVVCTCDCGNEKRAYINYLTNGTVVSCGCKRRHDEFEASAHACYALIRDYAKRANIHFDLTFDQYKELSSLPCDECEAPPSCIMTSHYTYNGAYKHSKIAYFDKDLGYTFDKIQVLCLSCSHMRRARMRNGHTDP